MSSWKVYLSFSEREQGNEGAREYIHENRIIGNFLTTTEDSGIQARDLNSRDMRSNLPCKHVLPSAKRWGAIRSQRLKSREFVREIWRTGNLVAKLGGLGMRECILPQAPIICFPLPLVHGTGKCDCICLEVNCWMNAWTHGGQIYWLQSFSIL